jgi:hypothetical protein
VSPAVPESAVTPNPAPDGTSDLAPDLAPDLDEVVVNPPATDESPTESVTREDDDSSTPITEETTETVVSPDNCEEA